MVLVFSLVAVGGDDAVLSNEKLKMSAAMQAIQLVELLDGELKKN